MQVCDLIQRPCASDETNLPADIPSYLSSQGTLADRQEGYIPSENSSGHQYMPPSLGGFYLPPKDMNGKTPIQIFLVGDSILQQSHLFIPTTVHSITQASVSWIQEVKPTWRQPWILCFVIIKDQWARCYAGITCTPLILQRSSQVCAAFKVFRDYRNSTVPEMLTRKCPSGSQRDSE